MSIRARTAALGACVCVALLAIVWLVAFHIGVVGRADQSIYSQFGDLNHHSQIGWLTSHIVSLFDPNPYVYLVVAVLAVALLRGRPRAAFAVVVIVLGANVTTELLKHVASTPRPSPIYGFWRYDSWPSGHATAAMSLVLAGVLAAPSRLRPAVAALGACLAIAVGYSVVATGMHFPTDVLGGFLVATIWALATVAALLGAEAWRPSPSDSTREPLSVRAVLSAPGAVLLVAVVLTAAVLISRPHRLISYVHAHEAFTIGALGIGALGLALSTGVLLSLRR